MRVDDQHDRRAIACHSHPARAPAAQIVATSSSTSGRAKMILSSMFLLLVLAGCQRAGMFASDAYIVPDGKVMLSANVLRGASTKDCRGVPGVPVRFYHGDELLGEAITAECGTARLTVELPPTARYFRSEASLGEDRLRAEGSIFTGNPRRTVIVCDIDGTISATHYRELVFDNEDMASQPLPGSAETLDKLREHYGLIYLTARPGFLRAKTQRWLDANGFPKAPLIGSTGLRQSVTPEKFKSETIARLQEEVGNLRIGIGDAQSGVLGLGVAINSAMVDRANAFSTMAMASSSRRCRGHSTRPCDLIRSGQCLIRWTPPTALTTSKTLMRPGGRAS